MPGSKPRPPPPSKTMAKKKATKSASNGKKRIRRTAEQRILDMQAEIERLKAKAAMQELKKSASMKAAITALRYMDKGLDLAAEEGNSHLRHALADARRGLGGFLEERGVKLPKANLPKGPRPK